ncbi:MAG: nitroreductase family protein [Pseudomonadota bacterium]
MPERRPDVLDFLLTRRSRPAKTLGPEAPSRDEIETLLTAASRTPDHGKLVPWRFLVLSDPTRRAEIADQATARMSDMGLEPDKVEKNARSFSYGGVIVAVILSPAASEKIPMWEQEMSAGGVCLALLNAALASGWGANWLTGPLCRDEAFLTGSLGCKPGESVAGFLHLGNETVTPADRDRPEIATITEWV